MGFSSKIASPAFDAYKKGMTKSSYKFTLIIAVMAVVGFPIYGGVTGDIDMPYSLYYGLGIGGMFMAIALYQNRKKQTDTTWDGVVINKETNKKKSYSDKNDEVGTDYTEYVLSVKRDDGKLYKHKFIDQPTIYNYYHIGDKVRHHKGFEYYEKYDKSKDTQILCVV